MTIRGPLAAPRAPVARVWVPLAASAFLAYFFLLLFCDFRRPSLGAVLALDDGVVVRDVSPGSAADAAGLREADRINSVQGRRLEGRLDWLAAELMFPLGRPVPVEIDRKGTRVDAALVLEPAGADYWLRPEALMLAGVRAVQGVTLAAALLVWRRRSSDLVGSLGGWLLAATAVFTVVPPYRLAAVWTDLPLPLGLLFWGPHLSVVAIGAVLFSFFAVFPRRWLRRPSHWALAWIPMGLTLGWYVRFVFDMFYRPGFHLDGSALAAVLLPVTAGYVIAGLTLLVWGYRTVEGELERRRTRVVVASSMAALLVGLPVVIGYWARPRGELSHSLFASPLFAVGTIWMLIFPLGFTYAILRHRLFDVPAIIRRGIQYALARQALLSVLPLTAAGLAADVVIHRSEPLRGILAQRGWLYAGLIALAAVARLRRDTWLDLLDRRFFRERYNAHRLLRSVAADIRRAGSFEDASSDVVARIEAALHPTMSAVLLRRSGGCERVAAAPAHAPMTPLRPTADCSHCWLWWAVLSTLRSPIAVGLPPSCRKRRRSGSKPMVSSSSSRSRPRHMGPGRCSFWGPAARKSPTASMTRIFSRPSPTAWLSSSTPEPRGRSPVR